jgi:quinol monooxygenase YgiN
MPQVIVAATLDFATQENRDEAVRLTAPVQLQTRNEEAGCHAYCFAADPCVPTRIQVYELWEDRPSLLAHFTHPYYARMVEILRGIGIVDTWNQVWETGDHGAVYGPDGKANEAFFGGVK